MFANRSAGFQQQRLNNFRKICLPDLVWKSILGLDANGCIARPTANMYFDDILIEYFFHDESVCSNQLLLRFREKIVQSPEAVSIVHATGIITHYPKVTCHPAWLLRNHRPGQKPPSPGLKIVT